MNRETKYRLAGFEKIANGAYYGYLPKVGGKGLAIFSNRWIDGWHIKLPKLTPGDYWYQEINEKFGWQWNHGIVNSRGEITQIG